MLASDGGSAKVVHALVTARAMIGIQWVGLVRAMRPGGDAPLEADRCCLVPIRQQPSSNGTACLFST